MDLSYILSVFRSRMGLMLSIAMLFVGIAAGYSLLAPRRYVAEASVLVDSRDMNPVLGVATQTNPMAQTSNMVTQVDVIRSERVARQVVKDLRLDQDPKLQQRWQETVGGSGEMDNWMANALLKDLTVRAANDSSIIRVGYADKDPAMAAKVANAFATAYLKIIVEMRIDPARQSSTFFTQKVSELRSAMTAAQGRLSEFQKAHGLLDAAADRYDSEVAQLNELGSKLAEARSESVSQKSRAGQSGRNTSEVLQSPAVQRMKAEVSVAQVRLDQLQSRLGPRHPEYQRAESELRSLKSALAEQETSVKQAIAQEGAAGQARVKEMEQTVQSQKRLVLDLQSRRDDLAALQGEVESAKKAYELVSARLYQTQMESQSGAGSATLLVSASTPVLPASPKLVLNLAIASLAGLLMAVFVVIVIDQRNPYLRRPQDISRKLGLPILATVDVVRQGGLRAPGGALAFLGVNRKSLR
jgi:polysaccharide biosynthesis transport protein